MIIAVTARLVIAAATLFGARASNGQDFAKPWTSPSSWYRPASDSNLAETFAAWRNGIPPDEIAAEIPAELICIIPSHSRDRAARLLGTFDIVPLSHWQRRALSCNADTDRIFNQAIAAKQRRLDSILGRERLYRGILVQDSPETVTRTEKEQAPQIAKLRAEIITLQKWRRTARPFLVKAVALSDATGGFSASVLRQDLTVHHESRGSEAVAMKNVPLVIFLKRKPTNVHHTLHMWPGPSPNESLDKPIRDEATVEPWHHQ
jgi:hypothetical protein